MYVFDSYLLILFKSIVSPSIHENLHAPSETARVINLVHYGGKETIHLLLTTYRQGIVTNSG